MKNFLSYFHPQMPIYLVYMLQQVEYEPRAFLKWLQHIPRLDRVMHRQRLVWTGRAKLLVYFCYVALVLYIVSVLLISAISLFLTSLLVLTPIIVIAILYVLVLATWLVLEQPRRQSLIKQSEKLFKNHSAIKIAIAGSYGKTSMKELLKVALGPSKKVAATPGNKNVPISHARWIAGLGNDKEVLLIEYGEGTPGDIKRFSETTHPDIGIITGLAPNHLDHYGTLEAVAQDLFSLADYLKGKNIYVNAEPESIKPYLKDTYETYGQKNALGWEISDVSISIGGTSFTMRKKDKIMHIKSGLLGRHQVGPLAMAAALSHRLGIPIKQVESNISKSTPYEHRMQPYQLAGAWVIDDAYNGSLEGFRAGLELLKELPARRKIYVTPGLVDQGKETEKVHFEIGRLIASTNLHRVVLMKNTVTSFIVAGLNKAGYKGELDIRTDPLEYYTHLEQYVAAGDLVMLQNDWTDNYQ